MIVYQFISKAQVVSRWTNNDFMLKDPTRDDNTGDKDCNYRVSNLRPPTLIPSQFTNPFFGL